MRSARFGRLNRGFTLIELLVVIGIITVLLAVLLPVLGKAREQARRARCAANLRGLGQALLIYTQDYRHYPGAWLDDRFNNACIWPIRLRTVLRGGSHDLFYCPSQEPKCQWKDENASPATAHADSRHTPFGYRPGESLLDGMRTFFSYGYNWCGAAGGETGVTEGGRELNLGLGFVVNGRMINDPAPGVRSELPVKFVRKPSQMIAIADTSADGWSDFVIEPGQGGPHPTDHKLSRWPGRNHAGGANVLFCDGHVQWYLQSDLVNVEAHTPGARQMRRLWNNDHRVNRFMP